MQYFYNNRYIYYYTLVNIQTNDENRYDIIDDKSNGKYKLSVFIA